MKILFTPHWNRYFSYFSNEQYDVYFKEEYVYLYETPTEKPYCAVIYENDSYMLFPFSNGSLRTMRRHFLILRLLMVMVDRYVT